MAKTAAGLGCIAAGFEAAAVFNDADNNADLSKIGAVVFQRMYGLAGACYPCLSFMFVAYFSAEAVNEDEILRRE
jgi:hypothetical protein